MWGIIGYFLAGYVGLKLAEHLDPKNPGRHFFSEIMAIGALSLAFNAMFWLGISLWIIGFILRKRTIN